MVAATLTGPLYLRIFDPDTGWKHDQLEGRGLRGDVRTRYSFFGGDGAHVASPGDPLSLTEAEMTAGTRIATRVVGAHSASADGRNRSGCSAISFDDCRSLRRYGLLLFVSM